MKRLILCSEDWKEKHGIVPQKASPGHTVCSIGFSEKEQKWYGWSNRRYYGFGIGYEVKEGDCAVGYDNIKPGFKCKTLADCKKLAIAFARSVA